MSGLLVKSTVIMKENLELMVERGVRLPVVLGGAALTRRYVEEDLRPLYGGRLEYANDAFAGLHFMDRLAAGVEAVSAPAAVARPRKRRAAASCGGAVGATGPALAVAEVQVPAPPFYGTRVVADIPLEEVFPYINEVALFRGQWQIRRGSLSREEYELTIEETVRPSFERLKKNCLERKLLEPKVVYGYYPCQSEGNDIIVYDEQAGEEVARFTFPRQSRGRQLCLADFFAPRSSGVMDVAAFHLVTVGAVASRHAQRLFQADAYSDYLYFHGLAVETAEALAEYWHKQIRVELGIAGDDADEIPRLFQQAYRGARFSFGYPASPRLEDQSLLFKLLDPSRIGVKLTEEFQLEPEQSTTAIIAHHPGAHYFTVE
jgi:5-methyltetrahydrofolate--homocysteine methyltransferase